MSTPGESPRAARDRELFDAAAARTCRKDLHRASRAARVARLEATLEGVPLGPTTTVLEVGCGAGFAARYLAGRYGRYLGVDHSAELLRLASLHNSLPGAHFALRSVHQLPLDERFDVVLMVGVLHHLDDLPGALRRLASLLVPGGVLAANEPQPGNPAVHAARVLRKRLDRDYSAEQVELSAGDLVAALEEAGLVDVHCRPQGFLATPFAEVALPGEALLAPVARLAGALDHRLAHCPGLAALSWNLVASGRAPNTCHVHISTVGGSAGL